jgi:hypothetical protein
MTTENNNMITESFQHIVNTIDFLDKNQRLKNYVINFNEPCGFLWTPDSSLVFEIYDGVDDNTMASPNAFALTLRACQAIYKGKRTLDSFK